MTSAMTQSDTSSTPPQPASAHPLWARPVLLACAFALAIVYGSLIPFDFAWSDALARNHSTVAALVEALAAPRWVSAQPGASALGVPFWLSDVLMNALLYLPLGVTLRMALRTRFRSNAIQIIGAVGVALVLSWMVETAQAFMPARVASLNDVLANVGGAALASLVAPALWGWYKRAVFACYCRLSGLIAWLRAWRDRPILAMGLAIINAAVIGVWYVFELQRQGVVGGASGGALPFERAFDLPYDLGAVVLGRAMLVYAGLGCLLLLLTCTGGRRVAMGWVVLAVALLALAAELSRAATHNAMPDVTGPLLALAAAALMSITVYTFSLAVKRSNRRRRAQRYDGPERRRLPHEYV